MGKRKVNRAKEKLMGLEKMSFFKLNLIIKGGFNHESKQQGTDFAHSFIHSFIHSFTILLLLIIFIFLSACDIIKTDSSYNNTTTAQMTGKVTLSGTIAKGSPIPNTPVKIKDKDGKTKEATSGSDGKYDADVSDMSPPFLLKVPEGDRNLYSVATETGTANVHPFTDLVVRNWYEVKGTDIDTAFDSTGAIPNPPTTTEIDTIEAVVKNTLATFLTQMGLDTTKFNMFTSQFNADSTGFDKLLDNTNITINNTTGQVTVNATDPKTGIGGTIISTTITADIAARDTTKPTDPTSLLAIAGGTDGIALIWNASSDNIGISGYNIYRNSAKTGVSPFTVYSDTGLTANTKYCYQVEAYDGAGNISGKSREACTTTLSSADTTAPQPPTGLTATAVSSNRIDIAWLASTDDDAAGYHIYRDTVKTVGVTTTTYSDTGLSANTKYCYTIKAIDGSGNISSQSSSEVCAITSEKTGDTTAPSNVSISINSGASETTSTSIILTLSAADDAGVIEYYLSESSTIPPDNATGWVSITPTKNYSATVSFTLSGVTQTGSYTKTVYVWFRDSAGNISASASDSITLTISDITAPSSPLITINSGATSTTSTSVTLSLSAMDNIGVTAYYVSENPVLPSANATGWVSVSSTTSYSTLVSFTLSSSGTTVSSIKTVYAWFRDSAGNISARVSDTITLAISDTTAPSNPAVLINNGDASTTSTSVTLTLSAADSVGVTGYCAKETSTTPSNNDTCWTSVTSMTTYSVTVNFTLSSGTGIKTIYVWFRDSAGNVSASANDSITLTISDSTVPSSPSVSINNGDTSTTSTSVTLTLSAADDVGVTAYYASETSTTPSASASGWTTVTSTTSYSATVAFTLSGGSVGDNTKTVYVWFRDTAGNVSAVASDSIGLAPSSPTGVSAFNAGSGKVIISWSSVSGATSYNIYWSTTSGVTKTTGTQIVNVTSSHTHTGLTNSTTYYYIVTAVNSYGESSESSQVSVIPYYKMLKLPDTGQTGDYTTTFGEDSDYTINSPSYTDNGNGTITDNITGLIWQKEDDNTTRTWADAGTYCDNLTLDSQTDWRLPSDMELMSIVNYGAYNPAINATYFPNTNASYYWSSTTDADVSSSAWYVSFSSGGVYNVGKTSSGYVRCVRGGQ